MDKKMRDIVAACELPLAFNDVIDLLELIPEHYIRCRYKRFLMILMAITTIGFYPFIKEFDIVLTCTTMGIATILLITGILLDYAIYRINTDKFNLFTALSTVKDYCEYVEMEDEKSTLHQLFRKYDLMNGAEFVCNVVYNMAYDVVCRIFKISERYTLCYNIMKVVAVVLFALNVFDLFIA